MMIYIVVMKLPFTKVTKELKSSNADYLLGRISSMVNDKWQVLDVHCEWIVSSNEVERKAS